VRISGNRVVKSGPNLRLHEAETLRFIAANTTIPVPKVHNVRWENGRITAITMDYIPGNRLDEAWDNMQPDQKLLVARELHQHVSQLRKLKGEYIGAVGRGKAVVGQYISLEGGPFDSEQLFNEFILSDIVRAAPDILRHYAKFALGDNHEIVFTHSDLAPRNILVNEEGHITAILDWEDAGWYPEYWEYFKALQHLKPMQDWPDYLSHILPPRYEKEYIGMTFLASILRH
jgi:aminoglycoside phosphotransferase (APT) family kinase protein